MAPYTAPLVHSNTYPTVAFYAISCDSSSYGFELFGWTLSIEERRARWRGHLERVNPGPKHAPQYQRSTQIALARPSRRLHFSDPHLARRRPFSPAMRAHRKWMRERMRL